MPDHDDGSSLHQDDPGTVDTAGARALAANVVDLSSRGLSSEVVQKAIDESEVDPSLRLQGAIDGAPVTIVKLGGKTNHFGRDVEGNELDFHATVPDTMVWLAEHPWTRDLGNATDETGWWTMYVVKDTGVDLELSFVYERDGWITTKTHVFTVTDADDVDMAIQFIDPDFYNQLMRPHVTDIVRTNGFPDFEFEHATVVTVAKTWASMHDDRLPHGDPGAVTTIEPAAPDSVGPVYFNEDVVPDMSWVASSVDGGVTWLNLPDGETYAITAEKAGETYPTVRFRVGKADRDAGVQLYIASPPDSLEGSNASPPGED